jgi:hypothetical protein
MVVKTNDREFRTPMEHLGQKIGTNGRAKVRSSLFGVREAKHVTPARTCSEFS